MCLVDFEHEDFWNFLIGKVYIIHAHDCEINFGCWLQESKCAFLDDDDENGSVQSQNLTMSWSILIVIQLIPIELEMTWNILNMILVYLKNGKLQKVVLLLFSWLILASHLSAQSCELSKIWETATTPTCATTHSFWNEMEICQSDSTLFFMTHLSISPLFLKLWAE